MDPYGNYQDVGKCYDWAVERVEKLEIGTQKIYNAWCYYQHNIINDFFEADLGVESNLENLEKSNPNLQDRYMETLRKLGMVTSPTIMKERLTIMTYQELAGK